MTTRTHSRISDRWVPCSRKWAITLGPSRCSRRQLLGCGSLGDEAEVTLEAMSRLAVVHINLDAMAKARLLFEEVVTMSEHNLQTQTRSP